MYFCKTIAGTRFIFSQNRAESQSRAIAILSLHDKTHFQSKVWSDPALKVARAIASGQVSSDYDFATRNGSAESMCAMTPEEMTELVARLSTELGKAQKAPAKHSGLHLHAAIDQYLADYQARTKPSRSQREAVAMATYKAQQPDCELGTIDADKLRATVNHFRARPKCATGGPMAVATVQSQIKAIKALYDWLDSADKWIAPRRFEKLFKVKYSALRTPLEIKSESYGVDTFTLAELQTLWSKASSRQKLYMGLALNTGETAEGLSSLMKADLLTDGKVWVIDRNRGKTGQRGVYPLWAEVQALVDAEMNRDPSEPLLFKSMDNKPLVWFGAKSRVDSVSKTWANLRIKCPTVRKLGHKYLRKTGASIIEKLTGSDRIAETYLSHKGQSVAKKHYLAQNFDKLAEALLEMRSHLQPMFGATPAEATEAA